MGLSMAKFAALRNATKQAATDWKKKGLLVFEVDGTVNVEASNAKLDARADSYRGGLTKKAQEPTERTSPVAVSGGKTLAHADAVAKKENFLALLRELEYDRESGAVVAIDDVVSEVVEQLARVRTKLLGIPTKVAGRLALLKSAGEVEAFLTEEIALALKELTGDTDGLACVRKVQGRRQ